MRQKNILLAILLGLCLVMTTTSMTCSSGGEEDHRADKVQDEEINPEPEKLP